MKILLLIVAGILLGGAIEVEWWVTAIAATALFVAGRVLIDERVAWLYVAFGIVAAAMTTTSLRTTPENLPYDSEIVCEATVESIPTPVKGRNRVDLSVVWNGKRYLLEGNIDSTMHTHLGQRGALRAIPRRVPEGSYGRLMLRRGQSGRVYVDNREDWLVRDTVRSLGNLPDRLQQSLLARFDRLGLQGQSSGVCKAMVLGYRGEINPTTRSEYSRSGAAHLLAISGLHVGIVAMLVWALCALLPLAGRHGHIWRNVICSLTMIVYGVVTGASPSVMRATLMFCTAQWALAYGTRRNAVGALCVALSLMLLANPNNLYDISFQLSALAVAGIMIGYVPIMERCKTRWPIVNWVVGVVIVGLCATLATLPLVAHTFGVFNLAGIALNPLLILTANVLVFGSLVGVIVPFAPLAALIGPLLQWIATFQNRVVEIVSSWQWAVTEVEFPLWATIGCYVTMAAVGVAIIGMKDNRVWKKSI